MLGEGHAKGSRVTLHVVSSLDGFIARNDNSVSWLDANGSVYEAGVSISAEEAAAFVKGIGCYVLGSRTYEHALELGWPFVGIANVVEELAGAGQPCIPPCLSGVPLRNRIPSGLGTRDQADCGRFLVRSSWAKRS